MMNVNFEFLSDEPIENMITCLHYAMDKVIYFGYEDMIARQKKRILHGLKDFCGVQEVVFFALPRNDLSSIIQKMSLRIREEILAGNRIFFDITGGDSLILVAFGALAARHRAPIHFFDISLDSLVEKTPRSVKSIRKKVPERQIKLGLERYVEMMGGKINYDLSKNNLDPEDPAFSETVHGVYGIAKKDPDEWIAVSSYLAAHFRPEDPEKAEKAPEYAPVAVSAMLPGGTKPLSGASNKLTSARLIAMLKTLSKKELIAGLVQEKKGEKTQISFVYPSDAMRKFLTDPGQVFEYENYLQVKKTSDDCKVSVHLDWESDAAAGSGSDVVNEVDILALNGNIPTVISCKSGNMTPAVTLKALYELDTVARKFGGKYAKKVLMTAQPLSKASMLRAAEMGIEVREA